MKKTFDTKNEDIFWAVYRKRNDEIDFCTLDVIANPIPEFYATEIFRTKLEAKRFCKWLHISINKNTIKAVYVISK